MPPLHELTAAVAGMPGPLAARTAAARRCRGIRHTDRRWRHSGAASVFYDAHPAVSNLDPVLLDAAQTAAVDAAVEGIAVVVTSCWRSPQYQDRLLQKAVPVRFRGGGGRLGGHRGNLGACAWGAVDVGPETAIAWLAANGTPYGSARSTATNPGISNTFPERPPVGCPAIYRTRRGIRG